LKTNSFTLKNILSSITFGPGTANMFRKMVGLSELSWSYQMSEQQTDANNSYRTLKSYDKEQSKLTDFLE